MPSDNRPLNLPIPLPLTLYVIPLVLMVAYIVQQLWAFICQSLEEEENLLPSSSSPSLSPPPSSEEEGPDSAYATLSPPTSPILPVRMKKGKQQAEETPLLDKPIEFLPCLICQSVEHALRECPEFHKIPVTWQKGRLCILCQKEEHGISGCPEYRCPICLYPTPGHRNNSCSNSLVDPDSSCYA